MIQVRVHVVFAKATLHDRQALVLTVALLVATCNNVTCLHDGCTAPSQLSVPWPLGQNVSKRQEAG
jgi:hypothetical protein